MFSEVAVGETNAMGRGLSLPWGDAGTVVAGLQDQAHVARTRGPDIFLYGRGGHGNLHASTEFLETSPGWR